MGVALAPDACFCQELVEKVYKAVTSIELVGRKAGCGLKVNATPHPREGGSLYRTYGGTFPVRT
jgi:hypothetical protein